MTQCCTENVLRKVGMCDLCGLPLNTPRARWCDSCLSALCDTAPRCPRCGLPLALTEPQCGTCLKKAPQWQSLVCLSDYQFPTDWYVKQMKYHRQFTLAYDFAQLLAERITDKPQALIAVPMHWRRRFLRGYNHSDLLANALSKRLSIPNYSKALRRTKHTIPQQGLPRSGRLKNLNHAFQLRGFPTVKHVAIVDDVVTTGSTVHKICQLLLEVGVERIDIYCICRTPEPTE